jgi:hypothetical protein
MTIESIDAVLDGYGQYKEKAYFFKGDQYVRYNWTQDRAEAGAISSSTWGLTGGFAVSLDATLNGQGQYEGKAYFFRADQYVRYDWGADRVDLGPRPTTAWGLTGGFAAGVDTAFNGRGPYQGKAYFFKADQYVRYDWTTDQVDQAPRSLTAWGLSGDFASGVAAALNGQGAYKDKVYFFKGDQYVRYDWTADRVDRGPVSIVGNWPGVYELMLAGIAKSTSFGWLWAALPQLTAYGLWLQTGAPFPFDVNRLESALATHFHVDKSWPAATKLAWVNQILTGFQSIEGILHRSPEIFQYRSDDEALADGMVVKDRTTGQPILDASGRLQPFHAYGSLNGKISFTRLFPTHGPLCRAAEVTHETVHIFDGASGSSDTHIPEWYVTDGQADALGLARQPNMLAFATRYDLMAVDKAVHNPSAYAAFAQHIFYQSDKRFGAGRPTD